MQLEWLNRILLTHSYLCQQIVAATTNNTAGHGSNMTTMVPESEEGEKGEFLNLMDKFLRDLLKYAGKKCLQLEIYSPIWADYFVLKHTALCIKSECFVKHQSSMASLGWL